MQGFATAAVLCVQQGSKTRQPAGSVESDAAGRRNRRPQIKNRRAGGSPAADTARPNPEGLAGVHNIAAVRARRSPAKSTPPLRGAFCLRPDANAAPDGQKCFGAQLSMLIGNRIPELSASVNPL